MFNHYFYFFILCRSLLLKGREWQLAYFHGVASDHFIESGKNLFAEFYLVRLASLVFFWLRRLVFRSRVCSDEILLYAGSANQLKSISPLIPFLAQSSKGVRLVLHPSIAHEYYLKFSSVKGVSVSSVQIGIVDFLMCLVLLLIRLPYLLWLKLTRMPSMWLDRVQASYFFLFSFGGLVRGNGCKLAVMANDHNADCNALMLAASEYNVRTVYVQHAQVTSSFPRLHADVCVLYGQFSLDTYAEASGEVFSSPRSSLGIQVLLAGQMNTATEKKVPLGSMVGLSINNITSLERFDELLKNLLLTERVCLRYHPRQFLNYIGHVSAEYSEYLEKGMLDISHGPISDFAAKLKYSLAGASSVHLDLLSLGVPSHYVDIDDIDDDKKDYYGFLKSGLISPYCDDSVAPGAINQNVLRQYVASNGALYGAVAPMAVSEFILSNGEQYFELARYQGGGEVYKLK